MEKILSALRELGVEQYVIRQTHTDSLECFFVRKDLDLKRRSETVDTSVTVYRPFEKDGVKMLGDSAVSVHPGMAPEQLRAALEGAWFAAQFVANPWYPLPAGRKEPHRPAQGGFAQNGQAQNMRTMVEALFAEDTAPDVFINSAEVFMRRIRTHIVTSQGADVSWDADEVWGEYVCQCPAPQDVETYHQFSYREPETDALRRAVAQALETTRARARAAAAPKTGEYALVLEGRHIRELMRWYVRRADCAMIYQKFSPFAVGDSVQGPDVTGDKLTVTLRATEPYTGFGVPMADRQLMEDGVLKTLHGGVRFSHYLGVEPTGSYSAVALPSGTVSAQELKDGCLYAVAFSDFQMDAFSGHFGGELRLGFLCENGVLTPVTGGSVNGSILSAQGHMRFSRERFRCADYDGPLAVRIEGVQVAGS